MVSAVLLQIMTEGPIEKVLYGNPQVSFFKKVYRRPTNFASKYSVKTPHGNVDWGQTITIKVPREADLLGGVNIRIKLSDLIRKQMYILQGKYILPGVVNSQEQLEQLMLTQLNNGTYDTPTVSNGLANSSGNIKHTYSPQNTSFCNGIGTVLIEHISIYSGSKLLEKLTGEYIFLDNELNNQGNSKSMFYDSIGFKQIFNIAADNVTNLDMIIPIPFFFTKDCGSYLPIMAMNNEEVTIRIKLRSFEECLIHRYNKYNKYSGAGGGSSAGIYGYISFAAGPALTQTTPPATNPDGGAYFPPPATNIQPLISVNQYTPIKEVVTSNIDVFEIIYKYYHISRDEQVNILKSINNYVIPITKEIYSHSFNPGSTNSTEIPLEFVRPTKFFTFTLQRRSSINDHDYYNYTTINNLMPSGINNGDRLFAAHNNNHILERFNLSLDGIDLLDNIPAKILNNIELLTKFKNNSVPLLYAYSFAMDPINFYPSGTLNFSNFLKQYIRIVTVDSNKFEDDELQFTGYYVSYNVLTVEDGLSGLRYV